MGEVGWAAAELAVDRHSAAALVGCVGGTLHFQEFKTRLLHGNEPEAPNTRSHDPD